MSIVTKWLSDLPKKCDKDFHVKVAEKPESVRYILSGQHEFQKISPCSSKFSKFFTTVTRKSMLKKKKKKKKSPTGPQRKKNLNF